VLEHNQRKRQRFVTIYGKGSDTKASNKSFQKDLKFQTDIVVEKSRKILWRCDTLHTCPWKGDFVYGLPSSNIQRWSRGIHRTSKLAHQSLAGVRLTTFGGKTPGKTVSCWTASRIYNLEIKETYKKNYFHSIECQKYSPQNAMRLNTFQNFNADRNRYFYNLEVRISLWKKAGWNIIFWPFGIFTFLHSTFNFGKSHCYLLSWAKLLVVSKIGRKITAGTNFVWSANMCFAGKKTLCFVPSYIF